MEAEARDTGLPDDEGEATGPGQGLDDGDPGGFVHVHPLDPSYPSPERLAKLKGTPVVGIRVLPDDLGDMPDPAALEAQLAASDDGRPPDVRPPRPRKSSVFHH